MAAHVRSGRATALVELHDLNLAFRYCSQAVLLDGGKVAACGPIREALTEDAIARAYGVPVRIERCSLGYPVVLTGTYSDEHVLWVGANAQFAPVSGGLRKVVSRLVHRVQPSVDRAVGRPVAVRSGHL